jgi:hypothetical protein
MSQHCPGCGGPVLFVPWRIEGEFDAGMAVEIIDSTGDVVCRVDPFNGEWADDEIARMRVIAAAPDLLVALRKAVKDCRCTLIQRESGHLIDCFVPDALIAIAKARG